MIRLLKRWVSRLRGPKPYTRTVGSDAILFTPEPEGNGWLAPNGYFHPCSDWRKNHAQLAFCILFPDAPRSAYDPGRSYERELELQRYVKFTESVGRWNGWHRSTRMSRVQRDVIIDWYLSKSRRLPDWLEALL